MKAATAVCPCCGSVVAARDLPDEVEVAEAMDRLRLTMRSLGVLFLSLWNAGGRTVPRQTLLDLMDRFGGEATDAGLRTAKKRLGQALAGHPLKIVPLYGVGYRMTRPAGWHWRDLPL